MATPEPAGAPAANDTADYEILIIERRAGQPDKTTEFRGEADVAAAMLRGAAEQIRPVKVVMRTEMPTDVDEAVRRVLRRSEMRNRVGRPQ